MREAASSPTKGGRCETLLGCRESVLPFAVRGCGAQLNEVR